MSDEPTLIERLRRRAQGKQLGDDPLATVLGEAADELEAWDRAFNMYWEANRRATLLYKAANPNDPAGLPDQSRMIDWLCDQIEGLRESLRINSRIEPKP